MMMLTISNYTEAVWSEWEIGSCSSTCGKGVRADYRDCLQGPCEGDKLRTIDCFGYECESKFNKALEYCKSFLTLFFYFRRLFGDKARKSRFNIGSSHNSS